MKRRLFEDLVLSADGRPARRGFAWPVSVTVHVAAVAGLLALPAFTTEALPDPPPPRAPLPRVVTLAASPAPTPGPPVPPRPRQTASRPAALEAPARLVDARAVPDDDAPLVSADDGRESKDGPICLGCAPPAIDLGLAPGPPSQDAGTPTGGGPVPVGGVIQPPAKLRDVRPIYPDLAKVARVQGPVVVECIIAPDGRVEEVHVVSGHPLLQGAALTAVRQWRYTPTRLNGIPVAVVMTVTVHFILQS